MTPATDAIQLARCIYLGNYESFWSIVNDYLNDDDRNAPVDDVPILQLVIELADEINSILRVDELPAPQEWFDTRLRLAQEGRDRGVG